MIAALASAASAGISTPESIDLVAESLLMAPAAGGCGCLGEADDEGADEDEEESEPPAPCREKSEKVGDGTAGEANAALAALSTLPTPELSGSPRL